MGAEVVVGPDDLQHVPVFMESLIAAARSVGRITTRDGRPATCVLIGASIVITNNHVFTGESKFPGRKLAVAKDAARAEVKFNYEQDARGKLLPTQMFTCRPDVLFHANRDLDFAVVGLDGKPGGDWGWSTLPDEIKLDVGDDVFVIQHPGGGPKQIAASGNEVYFVDERVVQYTTDTLEGSSGSPVFDARWRLVALHHAGGTMPGRDGEEFYGNEGTNIAAIHRALAAAGITLT